MVHQTIRQKRPCGLPDPPSIPGARKSWDISARKKDAVVFLAENGPPDHPAGKQPRGLFSDPRLFWALGSPRHIFHKEEERRDFWGGASGCIAAVMRS